MVTSINSKPLIYFILGTRPEAIKLCPVILRFKSSNLFNTKVILTGQHREMVFQILNFFKIDHNFDLNIMGKSNSLNQIASNSLIGLENLFAKESPDMVFVQGDTNTAFAGALAAFYHGIKVAHIEAGLRTNDVFNPFPEEANRRLISQLATLNFTPTIRSSNNLKNEGVQGKIYLTGNTVIDSILFIDKKLKDKKIDKFYFGNYKIILTTVHRRENWGINLENIADAITLLIKSHKDIIFLLPMHPNPIVRNALFSKLNNINRVKLIEPLEYFELVYLMKLSYMVLTDSGGLQEEAPTFGKPVLVLRENTERPEAIENGTAKLIGTAKESVFKEVSLLLENKNIYENMSNNINPFGDGEASERIFQIVKKIYNPS